MDEGRKRVILIAGAIRSARKLSPYVGRQESPGHGQRGSGPCEMGWGTVEGYWWEMALGRR